MKWKEAKEKGLCIKCQTTQAEKGKVHCIYCIRNIKNYVEEGKS